MNILDFIYEEFIALLKRHNVLNSFNLAVLNNCNYSVFDKTAVLRNMHSQIINHSFSWSTVPIPESDSTWWHMNDEWAHIYEDIFEKAHSLKLDPLTVYHGSSNDVEGIISYARNQLPFTTYYTVGELFCDFKSYATDTIVWPYSDELLVQLRNIPSLVVLKTISKSNILTLSPLFCSVISAFAKGPLQSILFNIVENPTLNYIDMDIKTGKVSYLTKDKISEVPEEEYFTSRKRTTTTIGKMLVKLDVNHLLDKCVVEEISNYFRGLSSSINVQVWEGDDIKKAYLEDNYASPNQCINSTLHNSCMRYEHCQPYFEFYKAAHAKIAVILDDEGKIESRALLWEVSPGLYYLDRIYYNAPFTNIRFVTELQKKYKIDYYRIDSRIYSGKNHQEVKEGFGALNYCIRTEELKNYDGKFPYVDTFSVFFKEEGCLYPPRYLHLHSTSGKYD